MDLTAALIAAFASLVAAGLAATVSLIATMLSKEQKTSEFRQEWVDGLRSDIAEFLAETDINFTLGRLTLQVNKGVSQEQLDRLLLRFMTERSANMTRQASLVARIKLRLNPMEHEGLLKALDILDNLPLPKNTEDAHFGVPERQAVLSATSAVLKREWQRVKAGEPAFVWTKRVAITVLFLAVAGIVFLTVRAVHF